MPPEIVAGLVEQPQIDGGPTAHPELEADEIKRLALRGVGALILRSIGQRGMQMIGNVLLARWLAPTTFGLYAIVSFVIGIAGFLADLGLGASLIQRREKLSEKDLRTAFTLSLVLNGLIVVVLWALAGPIVSAYGVSGSHATAVRVMSLSVLFSSFTVIPTITLERSLRFKQISVADLAGQMVYLGVTVPLAFGYRAPSHAETNADAAVWIFVWGSLASRAVHTAIMNLSSRWRPRIGLDLRAMRTMLAFGLPYQATGFVNALKDNFIPTFVAAVAGATAVGYITWAVGMVTNALILLPVVSRVTFPAYARLQHDPEALRGAIESSIKWVAATVFPATLLIVALARQFVEHVYGPKWAPGLPSVYLLSIPMLHAAYSTVMVSALYGLGRARTVLRLTVIWAIAGWGIGVPLTLWLGEHGFALGMSIVSWMSIMTVREMNKVIRVRFVRTLAKIFILAGIPAAIIAVTARFVVTDGLSLAAVALAGGAVYLALLWVSGELADVKALLARRRAAGGRPAETAARPAETAVIEHA
ncbi:MAG TPA: oligosaccharide flippase family protein [Actinomycetota bacterium]